MPFVDLVPGRIRLATLPPAATLAIYLHRLQLLTCEPLSPCELARAAAGFAAGISIPQLAGELYAARVERNYHGNRSCFAGRARPFSSPAPLRFFLARLKSRTCLRALQRRLDHGGAVPPAAVPRTPDHAVTPSRIAPSSLDAAPPHPGDDRGASSGVRFFLDGGTK